MRKLIESTHVALGGEIGSPQNWAFPYLDDEHMGYATELLAGADALLLGRRTYEGLSAAYTAMASTPFVDRMNSIAKYVASRTLTEASWNASVIPGDVAEFVADLKRQPGGSIVKYGNGPLDRVLMENNLIDEFHLLLTPVAAGSGQHMFEAIHGAPQLSLADVRRFASGVLVLVYTPKALDLGQRATRVARRPARSMPTTASLTGEWSVYPIHLATDYWVQSTSGDGEGLVEWSVGVHAERRGQHAHGGGHQQHHRDHGRLHAATDNSPHHGPGDRSRPHDRARAAMPPAVPPRLSVPNAGPGPHCRVTIDHHGEELSIE